MSAKEDNIALPIWTVTAPVAFVVHARDEAHAIEQVGRLYAYERDAWLAEDEQVQTFKHIRPPSYLKRIALLNPENHNVTVADVNDGTPEEDPLAAFEGDDLDDPYDDQDDDERGI